LCPMWCQFQQREFLSLKDESESGRVINTFSSFRDEKVFFIFADYCLGENG
jgi:hypothetical protein